MSYHRMSIFLKAGAARPIEHLTLGQLLQDRGRPTAGILELMDEETWDRFTREFLRSPGGNGLIARNRPLLFSNSRFSQKRE